MCSVWLLRMNNAMPRLPLVISTAAVPVGKPSQRQGGERRQAGKTDDQAHLRLGQPQAGPGEGESGGHLGLGEPLNQAGDPDGQGDAPVGRGEPVDGKEDPQQAT